MPPEQEELEVGKEEASDSTVGEVSLKRIQLLNLLFVGIGAGAALLHGREMALGVLIGGVVMAVNLRIIVGVMRSVFGQGSTSVINVALYWAKFAGILLLIGILVTVLEIDPIGLLIGLSIFLIAIAIEATLRLMRG